MKSGRKSRTEPFGKKKDNELPRPGQAGSPRKFIKERRKNARMKTASKKLLALLLCLTLF